MRGIDTSYRTDYSDGKDPDGDDPQLQKYHQLLWSKPLPCGDIFSLKPVKKNGMNRLSHVSNLGNFLLSSDAITHTYTYWDRRPLGGISADIIKNIPSKEIDTFFNLGCTIGGYIIFPANQINKEWTINQERWFCLKDRFDLTLECIRLWYIKQASPLFDCLSRYDDFFRLFEDFKGYVDFFLLDDLVDENDEIRFWLPFEGFGKTSLLPKNVDQYKMYMENVSNFIKARNKRIDETENNKK